MRAGRALAGGGREELPAAARAPLGGGPALWTWLLSPGTAPLLLTLPEKNAAVECVGEYSVGGEVKLAAAAAWLDGDVAGEWRGEDSVFSSDAVGGEPEPVAEGLGSSSPS